MAPKKKPAPAVQASTESDQTLTDTKSESHDATTQRRVETVGVSYRRFLIAFTSSVAALVLFNAINRADSYVICSEEKNIYTVDPSNPRVQCISIKGSRIVDVGDYGKFLRSFNAKISYPYADQVLWSQGYIHKAMSLLPISIFNYVGVGPRVLQVESSSVVVPGLSGIFLFSSFKDPLNNLEKI